MKTLDEVLTKYGHNWLLHSLKDQHGQIVHLVKVQGGTVPMLESDIIDFFENRKTAFEINQLDRAKHMKTPWPTVVRP